MVAYILITTASGTGPKVVDSLRAMQEVRLVDRVAGTYDVIARVETYDMDALSGLIEERIHVVPGVERTLTCVAIP